MDPRDDKMERFKKHVASGYWAMIHIMVVLAVVRLTTHLLQDNPIHTIAYCALLQLGFLCFLLAMCNEGSKFFKWLAYVGHLIKWFLVVSGLCFVAAPTYAVSGGISAVVFAATVIIWKELAV